jgi:deoxyribonuclease (pyrimidine dimer)
VTRINTVDIEALADQHLMAEYRELPMVHGSLKRTLASKKGYDPKKVSPHYTLNGGHVYFWYNKKEYLWDRWNRLIEELKGRGYNISPEARVVDWSVFDKVPQMKWQPNEQDKAINAERINIRIAQKPTFYRWTKRNDNLHSNQKVL